MSGVLLGRMKEPAPGTLLQSVPTLTTANMARSTIHSQVVKALGTDQRGWGRVPRGEILNSIVRAGMFSPRRIVPFDAKPGP